MFKSKLFMNLLSVAIVIAVIYFAWLYLNSGVPAADTSSPESGVGLKVEQVIIGGTDVNTFDPANPADQFRALLASVSQIDFDKSGGIIKNSVLSNKYVDFSEPLPQIIAVRENPFAPLEASLSKYVLPPIQKNINLTKIVNATSTATSSAGATLSSTSTRAR